MQMNSIGEFYKKLFMPMPIKRLFSLAISPVVAIIFSFVVAGLVVLISGENPIEAYASIVKGAFGSMEGIKNTIRYTFPIILLAFSFALCFRCGYFNIGQEGQIISAAIVVALVSKSLPAASNFFNLIVLILAGTLTAGIVALIPAILKLFLGVNEVIISILMNYIILSLSSFMLLYSTIANPNGSMPMSLPIPTHLNEILAIVGLIIIVIAYSLSLKKTVPGYQLRMVGKNEQFSRASGIPTKKIIMITCLLGGVLSGLAAIGEILGVYHIVYDGFAVGMGFSGMTAAFIGRQSPIGMVLGALVLGALQSGAVMLPIETNVPAELVLVVQGFVMFFSTISLLHFAIRKKK